MDQPTNIVPIDEKAAQALQVTLANQDRWRECIGRHEHIVVDAKNRTVQCHDCGAIIDPFEFLLDAAQSGKSILDWIDHIKGQRGVLQAEVDILERRLASVRGKLKREEHAQPDQEKWEFRSAVLNPTSRVSLELLKKHQETG